MMNLIRRILIALGLRKPTAPPPTVQGGGPGDTPPPPR